MSYFLQTFKTAHGAKEKRDDNHKSKPNFMEKTGQFWSNWRFDIILLEGKTGEEGGSLFSQILPDTLIHGTLVQTRFLKCVGLQDTRQKGRGPYTNYVDKILKIFDPPPPPP